MKASRRSVLAMVTVLACAALGVVSGPGPAWAAANDNNVEWNGLFHDQGPLYVSTAEPS
ncbi:twin-arginine translocation signal domain-containing protein [Actinopolymorpha alba]|uniref:twin-arginine translocation signal domain-containing protein n=1 Tax=Actinopolymorpha alba TaxID=533267 RepID=UPI00036DFCE0|nr:twin-arginine translocation signal domain-containing protein [Actinopolymorpha alba]